MRRIAVFARRPVPGSVKTRLSPALPAAMACDLYQGLLADTLDAVAAAAADERWAYWDAAAGPGLALPPGVRERVQASGDLGARMAAAFAELLPSGNDRAVIVGADNAGLSNARIDAAFAALEAADVALAPASDGGYGLIALARPAPALFAGIDWSTSRVFEQTRAAAAVAGLSLATLEPLHDIDLPDDVAQLVGRLVADEHAAGVHTQAALRAMGLLE